jgi:hypothetical protein
MPQAWMPPMRANPEDLKLPASSSSCSPAVLDCLEASRAGHELTFDQGLLLANAQGADLQALVSLADALRREAVGDAITYVVNRNINFTNVCFVGCSFCGFGKGPGAPDAYSLSPDDVVRKARQAWETGATEVCIQGGLPRDLDGLFCAPSSALFPPCTYTPSHPWKFPTAWIKPECRCASISK